MEPKEAVAAPKKRGRRTKDEIEAERGATLAKEVARLSLSQLERFASALPSAEAEYLRGKLEK